MIQILATFDIHLDDYHRRIHRFDSMSLLLCEVQDTDDLEYTERKPHTRKNGFEGMTSGRVKNIDLDDYDDGADLGQFSLDYSKRVEYTGTITSLHGGHVVLKVVTNQLPEGMARFQNGYYDIRLMDSQAVLGRRLDAIKRMDEETSVTQYLYNKWMGDKRNANFDAFQYRRGELSNQGRLMVPNLGVLNSSQVIAVETAIRRRLSLIQGPPGTGKTRESRRVS